MHWDESVHGGFSTSTPWMRVNDNYPEINAAQQQTDKNSVLTFWKRMLALRKQYSDIFVYGDFELVDEADEKLFCFTKEWKGRKALVALNFTGEEQDFGADDIMSVKRGSTLLTATVDKVREKLLSAYEGRVYLLG
jgi:oligo-1,6-glucosidase